MQQIDYNPVKVQINIEQTSSLVNSAFRTVAFFYEDNGLDTPDELRVFELSDLPKNNFMYASKAYNFTRSVMRQNKSVQVILRKKRIGETYSEAYSRLSNEGYYFVVIESKDLVDVLEFNNHIQAELKLQYFSSDRDDSLFVAGRKIVYYFQPTFDSSILYDSRNLIELDSGFTISTTSNNYFSSTGINEYWRFDNLKTIEDAKGLYSNDESETLEYDENSIGLAKEPQYDFKDTQYDPEGAFRVLMDNEDQLLLEYQDITEQQASTVSPKYPEGSWIGRCGGIFPSRTQWLFKTLVDVEYFDLKEIPFFSNTSVIIKGNKVTVGTGTTGQGYPIDQQISLDWLKWAIERNCWNLLKTEEKVNATNNGLLRFEQRLKEVLDEAVYQTLFSNYQITEKKLDRKNNKVSFKFTANLLHSILGVNKVEGYIYQ
ncbi:MAG: hypothetical protein KBT03_07080 [Bacteroidales bacterium]|nr:hypothetical protein [Candidatus Scybalousia scybalohippi]